MCLTKMRNCITKEEQSDTATTTATQKKLNITSSNMAESTLQCKSVALIWYLQQGYCIVSLFSLKN